MYRVSRWVVTAGLVLFSLPPPNPDLAAQTFPRTDSPDYSKEPFVIEHALSKVVFENDGTSRQETSVRVRIQSASGAQQFGLLRFPYPSAVGDAEITYARVIKPDGTTVATPQGDILDMPADITRAAPFYSDVKEKQIAVKGLQVGDVLEFQTRLNIRAPLIPGRFWLTYDFSTAAIALQEELQVSVPRDRYVNVKSPELQPATSEDNAYRIYTWKTANLERKSQDEKAKSQDASAPSFPAVQLTSFRSWDEIGQWFRQLQDARVAPTPEIRATAEQLTRGATSDDQKIHLLYRYVSTKFRYIGIALGIGRYQPHAAAEVLSNGYGDCKDKHTLLAALLTAAGVKAYPALINSSRKIDPDVPAPSQFDHMITVVPQGKDLLWLDTTPEVAPFAFLTANLRDKQALVIADSGPAQLVKTPADPPFPSSFIFHIQGRINPEGTLEAKVETSVRGDTEVVLRAAFRRAPQPQWKDVVQAMSRAWSFAGTVSDVIVSSPEGTNEALNFKYTYTQKDYPDWRDVIRLPLPPLNLVQLSDDAGKSSEPIQLESPGEYLLSAKVELPKDLRPRLRAAVDIKRDFANYHASYSWASGVLHAERRMTINVREIPRTRSEEYRTFWKAVNDEQESFLSLSSSSPPSTPEKGNASPGEFSGDAKAKRFVALGDALFNKDDLDGAIAEYRKALALTPDDPRTHRTLGDALFNKDDLDGAVAEYREALRLKPDDPEAHRSLGDALFHKEDDDGAIAEYREALRLIPGDPRAHLGLGNALVGKHDLDGAIAEYHEALRLNPDDPGAHRSLGDALFNKGDLDGAIAEYRKALRLNPEDFWAHFRLGGTLLKMKRYGEAAAELEAAMEKGPKDPKDPKNTAVALSMGQAYIRSGEAEKGIGAFRRALASDSNTVTLSVVAHDLAEHNLRLDDALRYAQQAVQDAEDETSKIDLQTVSMTDLTRVGLLAGA